MLSFPAPELCQFADEELLLELGEAILPGSLHRWPTENGLRIWVDGDRLEPSLDSVALAVFQTLLGVLRAWRPRAGKLRDEQRQGLGARPIRDAAGNQHLRVGPVIDYTVAEQEIERFAGHARNGIDASQHLRNALWLHGRANRTAADCYMIHEYADLEFGGTKGIRNALALSDTSQRKLTAAANGLSPLDGGRHAKLTNQPAWSLDTQLAYVSGLLKRWIATYP